MQEISFLLEREYIDLVDELASAKQMSKTAFANKVWPDSPTPKASAVKWSMLRNISHNIGKSQRLLFADAHAMAVALEEDFAVLVLHAQARMMAKRRKKKSK